MRLRIWRLRDFITGLDREAGRAASVRNALHLAGLMPIVCPVADGSGVTGVSLFDATPEDVERIMSGDPGVQAGAFTYDIHPTQSFPGIKLPG